MRVKGKLVSMVVALLVAVSPTMAATGATAHPRPQCGPSGPNPAKTVDVFLARFRRSHPNASSAELDRALGKSMCLVRVDHASAVSNLSSHAGDVSLTPPRIYATRAGSGAPAGHYVIMYWDWLNTSYWSDAGCTPNGALGCAKNIGGVDAWGIALNNRGAIGGESSSWWGDSWYGVQTSSVPADVNAYGAGFEYQDRDHLQCNGQGVCTTDLNMKHGEEVIYFDNLAPGCHNYQAFSRITHTWGSTAVTGVSIGVYSVGFTWSTNPSEWHEGAASPLPLTHIC